jgi:FMN-dependent NADH-azoreductase
MSTLLHIDASVRAERSLSRSLSRAFVDGWKSLRPADPVIRRDIGHRPPPYIDENWIAACFTPESDRTADHKRALAYSDEVIAELEAADVLVIGAPMYNYGMPTHLKAWIDQTVRVKKTFSFDLARGDWPLEPVLGGKSLVLLTSSGEFGFAKGGIRESLNHLDTHLRTLARYLGAAHVHHLAIEYQEFGDERHQRSIAEAHAAVPRLIRMVIAEQAGPAFSAEATNC